MISIVLPLLNPNKLYFKQALTSILNQTFSNFELIIIEDPGITTAVDTILQFNDNRIKYIKNTHKQGFANQLNQGIAIAKENYIARFDGDDIAIPTRLEVQYNFLKQNPTIDIVGSNINLIDEQSHKFGVRKYPKNHSEICKCMAIYCAIAHPSIMGKKSLFVQKGGYRSQYGVTADYDLWARLITDKIKFYNIQNELISYRIHKNASKSSSLKQTLINTIRIKERYFRQNKYFWSAKPRIRLMLEKLLIAIPNRLVYKLFVYYSSKKELLSLNI